MEVRETADEYLRDGHFESETISSCADAVERKWERLMKMAEQRRAVVFTSYNFYRASEQVLFSLFKFVAKIQLIWFINFKDFIIMSL